MEVACDWHHQLDVPTGVRLAKKVAALGIRWVGGSHRR
jgi:hypothetical protein